MGFTATDLKTEAQRHRALAAQHSAIAESLVAAAAKLASLGNWTRDIPTASSTRAPEVGDSHTTQEGVAQGELSGMTQPAAILKILATHGPLTTREIFDYLNQGGMFFKNTSYIAAIMSRMKPRVTRGEDGRYHISEQSTLPLEKAGIEN
jgi:hypothetical protein